MNVMTKALAQTYHPFEIAFFRNAFGFLTILPLFLWRHAGVIGVRFPARILISSLGHIVAMLCFFTGLATAPLNDATALSFTTPLFATVGAVLFLGERIKFRRIAALAVGFAGILLVLRPGLVAVTPDTMLILISCMAFAGVSLMIKAMSGTIPTTVIVFWQTLATGVFSLPAAALFWRNPDPADWLLLAILGILGTLGWLCFTRAFALAEASAITPYEFARLPITAVLAYLLFGEIPDEWTWAGGVAIFAATVYIAHREAAVARRAKSSA
jgi:drug/metabolite transporter (DMT)-like permease